MNRIALYTIIVAVCLAPLFAAKENPNNFGLLGQGKTFSGRTMSTGTLFIGTSVEWAQSHGRVVNQSIYFNNNAETTPFQTVSNLGEFTILPFISTAFSRFIEGSISIPIYKDFTETLDTAGQDSLESNVENINSLGIGDCEFFLKIKYPFKHHPVFDVAILGSISFPTGHQNKGFFPKNILYLPKRDTVDGKIPIHDMYTANSISFSNLLCLTLNLEKFVSPLPIELSVNYGFKYSQNPVLDVVRVFNTSMEYYFTSSSYFIDYSSQTRLQNFSQGFSENWGIDPMFLSTGFVFYAKTIHFSLALDSDLSFLFTKDDFDDDDNKDMISKEQDYRGVERLNIDRDRGGEDSGTYYLKPMMYGVSFKIVWRGLFY